MNCYREWTESLSKTAPVEIPLSKIAVDIDNSYAKLLRLMYEGYTTVKWNLALDDTSCEKCKQLASILQKGIDLAHFLGFQRIIRNDKLDENNKPEIEYKSIVPIYRDAPIYNWAHVGCKCVLTVFNDETGDVELVTRKGE